jgi:hypothetical protein
MIDVLVKPSRRRGRKMTEDQKPVIEPMTEAHKDLVAPKAGRPLKQSVFHDDIGAAIGSNEAFKVDIPEGVKPATIVSELQKAAKEHGVKLKIWKRDVIPDGETVAPFVGFTVVGKLVPAEPEHPMEEAS